MGDYEITDLSGKLSPLVAGEVHQIRMLPNGW
jgi:hypothetical protein